jgi:hypothetical protein
VVLFAGVARYAWQVLTESGTASDRVREGQTDDSVPGLRPSHT